jgi:hypothetical protein
MDPSMAGLEHCLQRTQNDRDPGRINVCLPPESIHGSVRDKYANHRALTGRSSGATLQWIQHRQRSKRVPNSY